MAWAGGDLAAQSLTDRQLVNGILTGPFGDLAPLRGRMTAEYQELTAGEEADELRCGLLASRIALTWTRYPPKKTMSAVARARYERDMPEQFVRWALRAMGHFAGDLPARWKQYKTFVPGTAASLASLIAARARFIEKPADAGAKLSGLRPGLVELLSVEPAAEAQLRAELDKAYAALAPLKKLQADKQAVGELLQGFRAAYNARDEKRFLALWPAGHPATRPLRSRSLARQIEPSHWTIVQWEPVGTVVKGDRATAYVVARYRSRDGKLGPEKLQGYPAQRTQDGWKLR
jgi:hypothetical protein